MLFEILIIWVSFCAGFVLSALFSGYRQYRDDEFAQWRREQRGYW